MYKPQVSWGESIINSQDINALFSEMESEWENLEEELKDAKSALVDAETRFKNYQNEHKLVKGEDVPDDIWNEYDDLERALEVCLDEVTDAETAISEFDKDELETFRSVVEEGESITSEWSYGEQLIHENFFEEYAEELFRDTSCLPREVDLNSWPFSSIDWKRASEELAQDYSTIEVEGETYYVRNS